MTTTSTTLIILVVAVLLFVGLGGICVAIFVVGKKDDDKYKAQMNSVNKMMDKQNAIITIMSDMIMKNEQRNTDVTNALIESNKQVKEQIEKYATSQSNREVSLEEILEIERRLHSSQVVKQQDEPKIEAATEGDIEEIDLDDLVFEDEDLENFDDLEGFEDFEEYDSTEKLNEQPVDDDPFGKIRIPVSKPTSKPNVFYESQLFGIGEPQHEGEFSMGQSGKKYTTSELESLIRE